jgi:hypothetical protein
MPSRSNLRARMPSSNAMILLGRVKDRRSRLRVEIPCAATNRRGLNVTLERKKSNNLYCRPAVGHARCGCAKSISLTNLELVARPICLLVTWRRLNASERVCVTIWQTSPLLSVHGIAVNQAGSALLILLPVKNDTVL